TFDRNDAIVSQNCHPVPPRVRCTARRVPGGTWVIPLKQRNSSNSWITNAAPRHQRSYCKLRGSTTVGERWIGHMGSSPAFEGDVRKNTWTRAAGSLPINAVLHAVTAIAGRRINITNHLTPLSQSRFGPGQIAIAC